MAECTVCGKELDADVMTDEKDYAGETYYVCCPNCEDDFEENPDQYT